MIQKLKLVLRSTALLMIAVVMVGCASIISGTSQEVTVNSIPPGATVKVNGMNQGFTSVTLDLKRNKNHTIRIEMEGYQPYEVALRRELNDWMYGNCACGFLGVPGLVIDIMDGANYTLKPSAIQAYLLELETVTATVNVQESPKGNLQKSGEMKKLSTADQLKELKMLKDNGDLGEQEYEIRRKALVDQL